MADAIGLVISICELSAQLYKFYKDAKGRDDDISALRLQLLGLQEKSMLVRLALRRDGLQSEDQSQAERAVERCESEVKRMKERVDKLPDKSPVEGKPMTKAKLFFKGVFQNAKWPFQKSTIMAFSDDIRMCHSNLDDAIKLLQLNVSIRTIEELRALDDNVTRHMITSEAALADLKSGIEAGLQQVLQQLAKQRQELSRQAEIISNTITDEEVKKLLLDPDFQRRQGEIPVTNDKTYDLFRDDVQDYPQAAGLSKFLQTGTARTCGSGMDTKTAQLLVTSVGSRDQTTRNRNQKSQPGLLRSLLYSILSKERHLVHLIWEYGPGKGATYAAWRTADLWFCLSEVVRASDRGVCLFIDGLDELEETPESEGMHEDIVTKLIDVSHLKNAKVKIVVSSRPWKTLQALQVGSDGFFLSMEKINRRAIADYWKLNLSKWQTFADVTWSCFYGPQEDCQHRHQGGHALVLRLLDKAGGNFLWTTLVADSLLKSLRSGATLFHLRQNIESTPSKLTDYLRDRVVMRLSEAWGAQKPMALKMSIFSLSWIPFWMLRDLKFDQLSPAESGGPTVLTQYTLQEIRKMMRDTIPFLQECCRDILNVTPLIECTEMDDDGFARRWYQAKMSFTHRSVYDFLRKPDQETAQSVFKDLPSFFNNENFKAGLEIVRWTIKPATVAVRPLGDLIRIAICWESILFAIADHDGQHIVSRDLAAKAEEVCVHQSGFVFNHSKRDQRSVNLGSYTIVLCYALASYDLYTLTDDFLMRAPELLCLPDSGLSMLRLIVQERPRFLLPHLKLLEKVLKAGADPNEHVMFHATHGWSTPWSSFLALLDDLATPASRSRQDKMTSVSECHNRIEIQVIDNTSHFSPEIQTVLAYFLESGAELELDMTGDNQDCGYPNCRAHRRHADYQDERTEPLTILHKWLPMDDASGWPAILQSYMQPSRREELREERRKIRARFMDEYFDITEPNN